MSEPSPAPGPGAPPDKSRAARLGFRAVVYTSVLAGAGAGVWFIVGGKLWSEYQTWRQAVSASEAAAPVGYVGLNYRRSYNDRPVDFHNEKDGRKLLFAAKGEGPDPDCYDVTEADLDVKRLEGGYGRDSIPGVDAPIFDPPAGAPGRILRPRQTVYGVAFKGGARAYPKDLIEKIEVVNDSDGPVPFAVVFDRGRQQALFVERTVRGAAVTFGTTGYSYEMWPLLYDRKTRSLWLPQGDALVCVNGELKGTRLTRWLEPEAVDWEQWKSRHPDSTVLVGNDRDKPIPSE
jgi:hypothetical protein